MGKGGNRQQQVTTQETHLPPWVSRAAQGNLALANRLTDPFVQTLPSHMVAPFNEDQHRSFEITRDYAAGTSPITPNDLGWSYYRGFAARGPYTMARMGGIPQMGAAEIAPVQGMSAVTIDPIQSIAAQKFTDANIKQYMNPYTGEVIDSALADLHEEYGRNQTAAGLLQAAGGAFGGARHGIREAQVAEDHLRNVATTTSGLRNQAYNTAAGLIQSDQNRALQTAQANQQAALQRAHQQALLEQEANRHAVELAQQKAMQQANLNQQAASTNAGLAMQGRQADIDSRYRSDQQRLGAVGAMADVTLQAQQLEDQRILQNAALLNDIGNQQQHQEQAQLDAPFRALEIRNNTLRGTPFPQTQVTTMENRGGGKGGLLSGLRHVF